MISGEFIVEKWKELTDARAPFDLLHEFAEAINAEITRQFDRDKEKLLSGFSWREDGKMKIKGLFLDVEIEQPEQNYTVIEDGPTPREQKLEKARQKRENGKRGE